MEIHNFSQSKTRKIARLIATSDRPYTLVLVGVETHPWINGVFFEVTCYQDLCSSRGNRTISSFDDG